MYKNRKETKNRSKWINNWSKLPTPFESLFAQTSPRFRQALGFLGHADSGSIQPVAREWGVASQFSDELYQFLEWRIQELSFS